MVGRPGGSAGIDLFSPPHLFFLLNAPTPQKKYMGEGGNPPALGLGSFEYCPLCRSPESDRFATAKQVSVIWRSVEKEKKHNKTPSQISAFKVPPFLKREQWPFSPSGCKLNTLCFAPNLGFKIGVYGRREMRSACNKQALLDSSDSGFLSSF